jgi:hypothetical protein
VSFVVTKFNALSIASIKASRVRAPAQRNNPFTFEKASSMGLRSGDE